MNNGFSYATKLELLGRMEAALAKACLALNDLVIHEDRAPAGDSQAEFGNLFAEVNDLRGQVLEMMRGVEPLAHAELKR